MFSTDVNKFHFSGLIRVKKKKCYVMLDVNKVQNWIRSGLKIQTDFMGNTEVFGYSTWMWKENE